jgi:GNAT superfamily N-acetyltransferase
VTVETPYGLTTHPTEEWGERMRIDFLEQRHLPACAELFAAGYRDLRAAVPEMPARYASPEPVIARLHELHARSPLVGAFLECGSIVGFLGGMPVPRLDGKDKGVYCPEWGHAVSLEAPDRGLIYRRLYAALGESWVRDARLNHAITVLAQDVEAREAWFWNTFGLLTVDVVRGLEAVPVRADGGINVRLAGTADLERVFPVFAAHEAYYIRAPIWLPKAPVEDTAELLAYLKDPKTGVWIAEDLDGTALGMMKHTLEGDNACYVVQDPGSVACTGAYVLPSARGRGVGQLLLQAMVGWARAHGYARLTLDFEAANIEGGRFWLRYFKPVCYSLSRHVNDHILPR